tara:strand:- start:290 stop:436 length:147 start_codon:yes stop_codon:yes gene_type:complete
MDEREGVQGRGGEERMRGITSKEEKDTRCEREEESEKESSREGENESE